MRKYTYVHMLAKNACFQRKEILMTSIDLEITRSRLVEVGCYRTIRNLDLNNGYRRQEAFECGVIVEC